MRTSVKLNRRIRQRKVKRINKTIRRKIIKIKENQIDQEFKANETIFKMEKRLKHVTAEKLNLELNKIPILKAKLKLNPINIQNNEKEIKTEDKQHKRARKWFVYINALCIFLKYFSGLLGRQDKCESCFKEYSQNQQ